MPAPILPLLLACGALPPPGPTLAPVQEHADGPRAALGLEQRDALVERHPLAAAVHELRLDNGWLFLVVSRPGAPVARFETYVPVGSADESPGETGLAHLFEHLAFQGSDRIGTRDPSAEALALDELDRAAAALAGAADPEAARRAYETALAAARELRIEGEFARLLEQAGGARTLNASTTTDETRFVVSLPVNRIETWCWLESERFLRPVLRGFHEEREVVLEERRTRLELNPWGRLLTALQASAFGDSPYGHPALGSEEDVRGLTRARAEAFQRRWYVPEGIVTVIVGAVDPVRLTPLLERYFGRIPRRGAGREVGREARTLEAGFEREAPGPRRSHVVFDAPPMLALAWPVPSIADPDSVAIDLAVRLLGLARSSRLERSLVAGSGVLERVIVMPRWPGDRLDSLALVVGLPAQGVALEVAELAVLEQVRLLAEAGPTPEELAGAVRAARAELLRELQDHARLAARLAAAQATQGDWREVFRRLDAYAELSTEDVQRVFTTWLAPEKRIVTTLAPGADDASEPTHGRQR